MAGEQIVGCWGVWGVWGVWVAVAVLSPLFVMLLLLKVSGVPLLEKSADEKWGEELEYQVRFGHLLDHVPIPFNPTKSVSKSPDPH